MKIDTAIFGLALCLLATSCGSADGALATVAAPGGDAPPVAADSAQEEDAGAADDVVRRADWVMPVPELGYNAREGRAVFGHYCAPCHGDEGHGDGFNAYNLDPRPRDLSDTEFQEQRSDDDLIDVVRSGGGVAGLSHGMPPWGRTLNDRQIHNVVVFLRTLEPEEEGE